MGIFSALFGSKKSTPSQSGMLCDVCNATTALERATRISSGEFRDLLKKGFAIDETNIRMLTDSGISRTQAIEILKAQYEMSRSDWLLCSSCASKAKSTISDQDSAFERLIEKERAERDVQICADSPTQCDLCHGLLADHRFMIDGEIKGGPQISTVDGQTMGEWGYMCGDCFSARGVGIKWGTGQLFQRNGANDWVLVAGFQPVT